MDDSIQVSILVPIYKVEKHIEKMLDSIFCQTYPNIDYVFVNDCSPDNSMQLLNESIIKHNVAISKYKIINHFQNEGIAATRAECISAAKGDYVYFVDGDDWIEANTIEQMVLACNGGTIDIVGCDYYKDFESGSITYHHENYASSCNENMRRCVNYEIATVLWKMLIKRELFHMFHIASINIGEDYIISIKLFRFAQSFVSINGAFYHYVQFNQNRLSFQSKRSILDHVECVKEVERFFKAEGLYDEDICLRLCLRKFNIKSNFVLNKNLLNKVAYENTFPEAKGVWRKMHYSAKEKIKFWMAEHGLFFVLFLMR